MSSFSPSTWACTRRSASFVTASPVRRQQHTHVVPPCLRPFLVRPTILGARPGSCRKPPGPLHVKSGKEFDLLAFAYVVRCGLTPFSRSGGAPRTAVHVVGPGGCPIGQRDPAAAREVLSLRRQGPNAVQRAAVLPDVVAPRERWAKLAKRTLDGRRSPNRPAPRRTAPRHPARVAQIVARLSRRTDQIPSRAPPTPASIDARQRRWNTTQPAHDGSALNSAESRSRAGRCAVPR